MALSCNAGRHWRRLVTLTITDAGTLLYSCGTIAAFNYDYGALDGGGRSAISKGYEDIL